MPIPIPRPEPSSFPSNGWRKYRIIWRLSVRALRAVFALVFLICTAIVLGVFRLSYLASDDVTNAFLATVGGAVLAAISIGARTLLFGWLYLVALLLILEAVRREGWKWLWLVPPLFCLWVNSHGSWPMGMVLFGLFIACWNGRRLLGACLRDALAEAATAEASPYRRRLRGRFVCQSLRISSRLPSFQGPVRIRFRDWQHSGVLLS